MKKAGIPALALAFLVASCGDLKETPTELGSVPEPVESAAQSQLAPELAQVETPYVLVLNQGQPPADIEGLIADAGGELLFSFPEVGLAVANPGDASFRKRMERAPGVMKVGPTGRWSLPSDQVVRPELDAPTGADLFYYIYQWSIRRVGADQAWDAGVTGSHNTVVAILDTGIEETHPDLAPNLVYQACMQWAGPCDPSLTTHWHGTAVAGLVGAAFDAGYAVGVGPNLGLASYQIFEDGGGGAYDPVIWWAILDAAQPANGFQVINMSLGGYNAFAINRDDAAASWMAWNRVINYALQQGTTVVATAGNGAVSVNGTLYHVPGDIPGVINVGATGIRPAPMFPQEGAWDVHAYYSNTGAAVSLSAPGGDCGIDDGCDGPLPGGWYYYMVGTTLDEGGYGWASGTSFAAPHVSGAAGLIMDANPDLTPHQVAAILSRSADKIGSRQLFGHGMLDVLGAVRAASR